MVRHSRMHQASKNPRRIACIRCRTRKKRCDHAVPTCGECRRSGSECVPYGARKSGSFATVPVAYLRQLEAHAAEAQRSPPPTDMMTHGIGNNEAMGDSDGENDCASPFDGADYMSDASRDADPVLHPEPRQIHMGGPKVDIPNAGPARRFSLNSLAGSYMATAQTTLSIIGNDWLDHYANIYFRHVQPQWTFIDEVAWRDVYTTQSSGLFEAASCYHFVIQMVLAIGALVSSSFRADCPHLVHASRLHDEAMKKSLSSVTGHSSPLIRTQASLLMLLYAFHGPSPDPVSGNVMLVLMNCANLMDHKQEVDLHADSLCVDFEHSRNMTIMSSHILNEVVASAWTFPQTFMFEILDEKVGSHFAFNTNAYMLTACRSFSMPLK
ncbi:hypothetical protein CcaCcLH18_08664 [Colletotrichum camelliae]|nr:hypothetical protein CcaCcLH18_08664 [Colletotrichum camelliae]